MRFLIAIALAIGLASVAYGAAATLNVNGNALQYGVDVNLKCQNDADNVVVWYVTGTGGGGVEYVNHVSIGNVNSACNGQKAKVTLTDSGGNILYQSPPNGVTIASGAAGFDLPDWTITVASVEAVHVTIAHI